MYIKRKLEGTILDYLDKPEILAIIGPRQCGKTTLLRHLYETLGSQAVFLTFEDRTVLDLFEHNMDGFINDYIQKYKYVFIDEFQYAKHGGKALKFIFDTQHAKIIVSGSSAIDLTVKAIKYLVGRILVFSLYPLDFEEFLSFKNGQCYKFYINNKIKLQQQVPVPHLTTEQTNNLAVYFEEFTLYGGYPRVVLSQTQTEKQDILKNIYSTYFLREVKDILGLIDDYKLTRLIQSLALQAGNLIQYVELSQVSELSYQTVKKYLNFLDKTFICLFPKPYFKNRRVEIVKNPKVFFFDSGLRNSILNNFNSLDDRDDSGALLENIFASQLVKQGYDFRFWRTKKQSEVDFVVSLPAGRLLAIELKKTLKQGNFTESSVKEFNRLYKDIELWYGYLKGQPDILSLKNCYPVYLF